MGLVIVDIIVIGCVDGYWCGELVCGLIVDVGEFRDDLVQFWEDVVGKLDFGDWVYVFDVYIDSYGNNCCFVDWCVEGVVQVVFFLQVGGDMENVVEIIGIFIERDYVWVFFYYVVEC